VVETGTSSLYSAIRDMVDEPVLKEICKNIAADEFRHYKLFFQHMERMLRLEQDQRTSRWQRFKTAVARAVETDDDEIASAYHAGNGLAAPYNRAAANAAYTGRVFGFYQERHTRRAGHMFAQAIGINPDGVVARLITRALWFVVERRGRAFRSLPAGA
jgi:hypothetical protein